MSMPAISSSVWRRKIPLRFILCPAGPATNLALALTKAPLSYSLTCRSAAVSLIRGPERLPEAMRRVHAAGLLKPMREARPNGEDAVTAGYQPTPRAARSAG
jgi:hypothetical protein